VTLAQATAVLAALALVAVSGCGFGAGSERSGGGATVRVTRDFGENPIATISEPKVREDQTVMRLLSSKAKVGTKYGGRFVQSIDGLSGTGASSAMDWFYWVNGLLADKGAADYVLSPGDAVQWDYRNWRATQDIRAIVGAYPHPFVAKAGGKRFPVKVKCPGAKSTSCARVKKAVGANGDQKGLRVVVARWAQARRASAVRALERGPGKSGVFARFAGGGKALDLLGADGRVVRRAPAGTGIVAALHPTDTELVWLVTGLDDAGVERAARALNKHDLRDAFAVAAEPAGVRKLPLGASR
jgi:hypothetical protein